MSVSVKESIIGVPALPDLFVVLVFLPRSKRRAERLVRADRNKTGYDPGGGKSSGGGVAKGIRISSIRS